MSAALRAVLSDLLRAMSPDDIADVLRDTGLAVPHRSLWPELRVESWASHTSFANQRPRTVITCKLEALDPSGIAASRMEQLHRQGATFALVAVPKEELQRRAESQQEKEEAEEKPRK